RPVPTYLYSTVLQAAGRRSTSSAAILIGFMLARSYACFACQSKVIVLAAYDSRDDHGNSAAGAPARLEPIMGLGRRYGTVRTDADRDCRAHAAHGRSAPGRHGHRPWVGGWAHRHRGGEARSARPWRGSRSEP